MSRRLLLLCVVAVVPAWTLAADPAAPPAAPTARHVTLPKETLPMSEALAAIAKQTGILVRDGRADKDAEVQLKVADRTFWETLDSLADEVDLQPYGFNGDGALSLIPRRPGLKPKISHAGPYRVSLLRLTSTDDFENGGRSCAARLQILWEPTLKPFYINDRPLKVMAQGDKDAQPTTLDSGGIDSQAPLDGRIGHVCDVPVPVVPRANSKLVTLSGTFKTKVPGKMLSFTFPTLDRLAANPATLTQDKIACAIESVNLSDNAWSVKIRFTAPAGEKFESNQSWIVHNELILVSADGKRRLPNNFTVEKMGSEAVVIYRFVGTAAKPLGKPGDWHVTYTTPASIVEMAVPFTFKDVPLP